MSPHRLFRSPTAGAALLRSSRPLLHHRRHRFGLCVVRLEDRTLLSGPSGDVLAAVAPKIELGTPKTGTLASGEVAFFQIDPTTDGRLVARVHAEGATTRLSLLDGQGQVLTPGDGQSPDNRDDQIDLHVPAGTDYLEVENLGGTGAYTLTTSLMPSTSPFQPITLSTGTEPGAIVAGDFKGDGRTDLAVANTGSDDVSVLLGNGDGTFKNQVPYATGFEPSAIVAGDFTGDGRTDLAVANYGSNDVSVLLGNGDGTFQNQVRYAAGSAPVAVVVGDFNGDGRTDLAVANYLSNDVSVLLGNGDGTFQNQARYAAGFGPSALVVGDFDGDGDGLTDLAVANYFSNDVSVLLGNGDGTFQNQVRYAAGFGPSALVAGDFTGDGRPGLLTVNSGSNDLTLITDFTGSSPSRTFASGGLDPVAALMFHSGNGFDNLIVANNGDGHVALLKGSAEGLILDPRDIQDLLSPTALALSSFTGGMVQVYAATEGNDRDATLLTFQLGGELGATVPGLQPLRDAALPLIATLLTLTIETSTAEFDLSATNGEAAAAVSFLPVSTVTAGQSLPEHASTGESENSDQEEPNKPQEPDLPVTRESSSWQPFLMGLDEALDQFCRDSLDQFMRRDEPAPDKAQLPHALSKPLNLWQRDQALPKARGTIGTDSNHLPQANQGQIIDEAIRSLLADESRPVRTGLTPTSVPLTSDGTTPAETAPADATLLSTEPVQRQDGPLLSSYERGFEALTEFAVSLLLAAFVASRIDPPGTRHCTPRNPFSSLRLLRRPLFRFR